MSPALLIILAATAAALGLGVLAGRGRTMDLEEWSVGGRSFGGVFIFLLMAGEIYTTFTFLGAAGFIYAKGMTAAYIPAYLALNQVCGYWLAPIIWRLGKRHHLVSQPHFFRHAYNSRAMGLAAAIVGVAGLVPYLVLQLTGLGIIVSVASAGAVPRAATIWAGAAVLATYVMASGMRGAAWNAVIKDTAILLTVIFCGVYLPYHYYGGIAPMFHAIDAAKPGFLTVAAPGNGVAWFISTVVINTFGTFMWPHNFSTVLSARGARALRRNAVVQPVYSLLLLFVFLAGFATVLQVPGLHGPGTDLAFLTLCAKTFAPWFLGVIGATGVLTALVPGSVILTTTAMLLANDAYRGCLRPRATDAQVALLARILVPVVAALAAAIAVQGVAALVPLLQAGFNLMLQVTPAGLCAMARRNRLPWQAALAGIVTGTAALAVFGRYGLTTGNVLPMLPTYLQDTNIGIVALGLNLCVTAAIWALLRVPNR